MLTTCTNHGASQWNIVVLSPKGNIAVFGCKNTFSSLIYTRSKTSVWHVLKVELPLWTWWGSGIFVTLWIRAVWTCHPPRWQWARWNKIWGCWGFVKSECRAILLEASISSQWVLANGGRRERAIACGVDTVCILNIRIVFLHDTQWWIGVFNQDLLEI